MGTARFLYRKEYNMNKKIYVSVYSFISVTPTTIKIYLKNNEPKTKYSRNDNFHEYIEMGDVYGENR